MSGIRVFVIAAIGWLVYWLIRRISNKINSVSRESSPVQSTRMVRCQYCDIYITEDAAIQRDNDYYCSVEHYQNMISKNNG